MVKLGKHAHAGVKASAREGKCTALSPPAQQQRSLGMHGTPDAGGWPGRCPVAFFLPRCLDVSSSLAPSGWACSPKCHLGTTCTLSHSLSSWAIKLSSTFSPSRESTTCAAILAGEMSLHKVSVKQSFTAVGRQAGRQSVLLCGAYAGVVTPQGGSAPHWSHGCSAHTQCLLHPAGCPYSVCSVSAVQEG